MKVGLEMFQDFLVKLENLFYYNRCYHCSSNKIRNDSIFFKSGAKNCILQISNRVIYKMFG